MRLCPVLPKLLLTAGALALGVVSSCQRPPPAKGVPTAKRIRPSIRVVLFTGRTGEALALGVEGPCRVLADPPSEIAARLRGWPVGAVRTVDAGIRTSDGLVVNASRIRIAPEQDGTLVVDGRHYHGNLELVAGPSGILTAVNILPLEDYLAGVLGSEMMLSWPPAALQVQAIVSRSFALSRMESQGAAEFDLVADTRDQNYLGMEKESEIAREAVNQTRGVALSYGGSVFRAFYHSTCGGHTADVAAALQRPPIGPLAGVPCGFCRESRYYEWQWSIPLTEMVQCLSRAGYAIQGLTGLRLDGVGADGRAARVELAHPRGQVSLPATDLRRMLGPDRLRSTCFRAQIRGEKVYFEGRGWGHGVGLCQWGARGMAAAGYTTETILQHYYPGAKLVTVYDAVPRVVSLSYPSPDPHRPRNEGDLK
ncbi:MAG: SpoIID/LytB domain-containing protein [Planctomycetes bacterium]|nr:SpoIID/LytB domain-containing protein [Planctomycetota bacterium]